MMAAVVVDGFEMEFLRGLGAIFNHSSAINIEVYQLRDKILDLYMSSIALYKTYGWQEMLARRAAVFLFVWRFIGVILFELSQARWLLVLFPNIFEFFFLFVAYKLQYYPGFRFGTTKRLAQSILILAVPKITQEYLLHVRGAVDWAYFKYNIIGWPKL
ncbi:MAG: hypothetical protein A3J05_04440 [Candidatus Doudnabacteria bacterium RIFCSPLOWO2_02_FULL_48_13]|uniref:Uncharacterized protein n=1 Tax=Candidatus Doudnabacteria bacterium RIFCSPLOWO2_02_FULL_48_13 TaxID=1817845 RepID=A0A1F5Q915_9BACT|nr:MAG: hypothetical protein A3F44_02085 [Candidatus Doudnabacteria bacterium RIFCSPHIGHO2_12_FULL_47_25]OGE98684.1 MAG: hypothetical protein A3J05_04440 [Candidatus Doudnabacteria bacterium RIFCSPLOWO2_02_FULL_48_13]